MLVVRIDYFSMQIECQFDNNTMEITWQNERTIIEPNNDISKCQTKIERDEDICICVYYEFLSLYTDLVFYASSFNENIFHTYCWIHNEKNIRIILQIHSNQFSICCYCVSEKQVIH